MKIQHHYTISKKNIINLKFQIFNKMRESQAMEQVGFLKRKKT